MQTSRCIAAVSNWGCLHVALKNKNINNELAGDHQSGGESSLTLRHLFLSVSKSTG